MEIYRRRRLITSCINSSSNNRLQWLHKSTTISIIITRRSALIRCHRSIILPRGVAWLPSPKTLPNSSPNPLRVPRQIRPLLLVNRRSILLNIMSLLSQRQKPPRLLVIIVRGCISINNSNSSFILPSMISTLNRMVIIDYILIFKSSRVLFINLFECSMFENTIFKYVRS